MKSYHFAQGSEFGLLVIIITEDEMLELLGDPDPLFKYLPPVDMDAYNPNSLVANLTNAESNQLEVEHKRKERN